MPDTSTQPIVVEVANGRYDCFAYNTPPTQRDKNLFAFLDGMGGVSDSVTDGRYHFNIEFGLLGVKVSLDPIE